MNGKEAFTSEDAGILKLRGKKEEGRRKSFFFVCRPSLTHWYKVLKAVFARGPSFVIASPFGTVILSPSSVILSISEESHFSDSG
jgi:hypothetical protein